MREFTRPTDQGETEQEEDSSPLEIDETQRAAESVLHAAALRYKDEVDWADVEAVEIRLAFLRAHRMHHMAAGRHIDSLDLDVGMTSARFTLLLTLYFARDNLLAQNEISRELSVSRTNITNLIDGLERDGLVARVPNPADRRVSYAQLTKAGEQICLKLLPEVTGLMMDGLRGFTAEEKAQFKDFLYRVQRNVATTHPGRYARGIGIE